MASKKVERGKGVLWDGRWYHPEEVPTDPGVDYAEAHGINQKGLEAMCSRITCTTLHIKGLTASDLSPLASLTQLTDLQIVWAHKFTDASPLQALTKLKSLTLSDTKRWHDLEHICGLKVEALDLSGGMENANIYETLAPLARLSHLKTLSLTSVKVENDGLRPLADCKVLEDLELDLRFPTEDYAYLAAHMPQTRCEAFAPYVPLTYHHPGKDVMVVGFRKPVLHSQTDAKRLAKYVAEFEAMKQNFSSEPHHS